MAERIGVLGKDNYLFGTCIAKEKLNFCSGQTNAILQKIIRKEFADCSVITVAHRIPAVTDTLQFRLATHTLLIMVLVDKEDEIPQVEVAVKTTPVFNRLAQDFRYSVDYDLKDLNPFSLRAINGDKTSTYDIVEQMSYLYVRVIKAQNLAAKDLNGSSDPYAKITVGNHNIHTRTIANKLNPDWDQFFSIYKENLSSLMLEINLWDADIGKKNDFLCMVSFDLQEVPNRVHPDSPLASQWYRLEDIRGEGKLKGGVMLVVWMG